MKSQVTVFVIIMLVAIIVASMMFSNSNKKQVDIIKESEDVNLKQVTPVKIYIEQAMQKLLLEGLFLIGRQGGKIYKTTWPACQEEDPFYKQSHRMCNQTGMHDYGPEFPKYLEKSPYQHKRIAVGINHTRVDGFTTFSSDEPMRQPFAYPHVGKTRGINYLYGSQQPLAPISSEAGNHSIESQLADWISDHLLDVINMTDFERMGYTIVLPQEKPRVKVEVNEDFITARMIYDIQIEKSRVNYHVDEYYTQIKSTFREFYSYINDAIVQDISTKSHLRRQKLLNISGKQIAGNQHIESIPLNFRYDLVNFTVWDVDYAKNYNFPEKFLTFYMIRENRPPDADTVKAPERMLLNEYAIWYCFNLKTAESPFDPDEDDEYSIDPFPWFSPMWYKWYSRGDQLITHEVETENTCGQNVVITYNHPIDSYRLHTEPYSKDFGAEDVVKKLNACGNKDGIVTVIATDPGDVGDLIILKVGDQQDFEPGGDVVAPERYVDPVIIEDGNGRLNDVMSYRPVHCKKEDGDPGCCGSDGYWRFNDRPNPPVPGIPKCLDTCNIEKPKPFPEPGCDCVQTICTNNVLMFQHCDHEGILQDYPDYKPDPNRPNPNTNQCGCN